jgi:hypothetical protein
MSDTSRFASLHTKRTRGVETLGKGPLTLRKLAGSARHVVCSCISQDIVKCISLGHVLCCLANHNSQLRLVITTIVQLSELGQYDGRRPRGCKSSTRLSVLVSICQDIHMSIVREKRWNRWNVHPNFFCVLFVLSIISIVSFYAAVQTLSPMHRIVPTSSAESGESTRSITAVDPVSSPGERTEEPLKTLTTTSWPLYSAMPTSTLSSLG